VKRDIRPDELIDLAYLLAGQGAGPGRPRTVRLRRAISSAYYALFHELVDWATWKAVREDRSRDVERWTMARWYQHSDVRRICDWVVAAAGGGRGMPASVAALLGGYGTRATVPADLVAVAETFSELHNARQQADYDHQYDVTKTETLNLVNAAAEAIDTWRAMPDSYHSDVLLVLFGGPRPVRDR
jgi:hypothetical protein